MVAAVAVAAAALLAGPADTQERPKPHYTFSDGYTFEKAMRALEDAAAKGTYWVVLGEGIFRRTDEERDDLARWLGDMIVRDATRSEDVKYRAAGWLASYAEGYSTDDGMVQHRASIDALRRVFEEVEPTAACVRDTEAMFTTRDHLPVTDPRYRPRCARNPHKTAWCVAGWVLHDDEVNRAMGRKPEYKPVRLRGSFNAEAEEAPEVPGLSDGAAKWWGRCWDDRRPGR